MAASTFPARSTSLRVEVLDKIASLVTVAFGLVAALAWNTAIQATFDRYVTAGNALVGMYTYALVVTVVAVIATLWIGRSAGRAQRVAELQGLTGRGPSA